MNIFFNCYDRKDTIFSFSSLQDMIYRLIIFLNCDIWSVKNNLAILPMKNPMSRCMLSGHSNNTRHSRGMTG